MKNFDSLTLKYFENENKNFIENSIVQKIQLPTRYEIILNLRNIKETKNKKLYININPKYPHICFVSEKTIQKRNIEIPKNPPMFCMQLRKYLSGAKIKEFRVVEFERIAELYFDCFDESGSIKTMCLALEFMGKYSNIILYGAKDKKIIGSIHNISIEKSSIREIKGGINYSYPPLKQKQNILNCSYSTFYEVAKEKDIKKISDNFYYFSGGILETIFSVSDNLEDIFKKMQKLQNLEDINFLLSYWEGKNTVSSALDEYFSNILFNEILKDKKDKLKKILSPEIKKITKILAIVPDIRKALDYKTKGDIILSNLSLIKEGQEKFILNNDRIELDKNLTPQMNAQRYYNLYKKAKNSYLYSNQRYTSAKEKFDYYNSILFNIENSSSFPELDEIKEEFEKIGLIKAEKQKKEDRKIEKIEFLNYEIYLGKNNIQNDFLISKIAKSEDLWFHGLNFPSSHLVLKVKNDKIMPDKEVIEYCAKLVKENSKAKNSTRASIIMTKRKNLKKPPDTYPGYVTYKNEIEIVV